jgi:DNA-directed RNA polymerase specialized sigma24 family protein
VDDIDTWTADQCAAAWGVKTPTWFGYVSRGQAPKPLAGSASRRLWDADEVRRFPRPRAGASSQSEQLLAEMREVGQQIDELRHRQRELLNAGQEHGLEIQAMARALNISRQTAYSWLGDR